MASNWLYLLLDILSVAFPLAYSWDKRINYHKSFIALFTGIFCMMLVFIPWDIYFTHIGVWGFNSTYLSGLNIFNLPIEEWLFFICIPFSSVFIYECIGYYFPNISTNQQTNKWLGVVLGIILILVSLFNLDKLYTFSAFLGGGLILLLVAFVHPKMILKFLIAYGFVLIPFFIVNGILTGSFIENEVVWYNNQENLGIRLFTIPIEDTVYGFFMLLLTTIIFEWRLKRL